MNDTFAPAAVQIIPVHQLKPNPWNRTVFDPVAMEELVASIKAEGIEEPLIVRPSGEGRFEIASGNRRWLAAQKAGLKEVPCIVRELPDKEVAEMNITVNVQRENLPPLELARMVKAYMDQFKTTQQEAATEFGKSQAWVSGLLGFLKMPDQVQKNIRALIIGWDPLTALSKAPAEVQLEVSRELKEKKLKPTDIEKRCAFLSKGKGNGKVRLGIQAGPKDPLAGLWEEVLRKDDFAPDVAWHVDYKPEELPAGAPGRHANRDTAGTEGWYFFVKPFSPDHAREDLAVWFEQMAKHLKGKKTDSVIPELAKEELAVRDQVMGLAGKPRIPRTPEEEKELLAIALRGTPKDVYAWIYGPDSFMTKVVPFATWEQSGQTPQEGLKAILAGIRQCDPR